MKCPRCKTILCRIEYEGAPICTCPDCKGEFVDATRLRRIEKTREKAFSRQERERLKSAKPGPAGRDETLICPRCGSVMKKGRYRDTDVVVDLCKSCKGVWLDDQELEKIQVLAEEKSDASAALMHARRAEGESTAGQGYLADASLAGASMSAPALWLRLLVAGAFGVVLGLWVSGFFASRWGIRPEDFGRAGRYIPYGLALAALGAAATFTRVRIEPRQGLEVTRFFFGLPWTRRFAREELKCLGADYKEPGLLAEMFRLSQRRTIYGVFDTDSAPAGVSYLYVVLRSGRKVRVYKGKNEAYLGELADFLQAGLGLEVRRL